MYRVLGVLHLYLARDVVRYLDVIVVIGWLTVLAGVIVTVVDFAAGMPPLWSWSEGPPTVLAGLAYIWLARRAEQPAAPQPGGPGKRAGIPAALLERRVIRGAHQEHVRADRHAASC